MRKKIRILILTVTCLMISGCANVKDYLTSKLEEKAQEKSGILDDQDYQEYQEMKETGKLDESGYYVDAVEIENEDKVIDDEPSGQIHVTFAENSHIRFTYYLDAEHTEQIDITNCYLNPGDCIYASEPNIIEAYSDKYVFSEFKILQFDSNDRPEILATVSAGDKLFFEIPSDYTGNQISVLPLGKYEARVLTLDDRYLNVDGNEIAFQGIWRIGSEEYHDTTAEISATVDYKVTYDYSDYIEDFYFVKSSPEPYRTDDTGIIEFSDSTPQNGNDSYYVLLHKYIDVRVFNEDYSIFKQDIIKSLSVNGGVRDDFKKKELMLEKVKCGDVITLRVDNNYKVIVNGLDISDSIDVSSENAQEYKITIPETVELELGITVSKKTATLGGFTEKSINNATISVTDEDGNPLQIGEEVDDNEKLIVTIAPADGYYVTGKKVKDDIYQDTMKYKEYVADIDKIIKEHPVKKFIYVTLDDSDNYGTCTYTVNGKAVSGTAKLHEGEKVKLEYTLTDDRYQIDRKGIGSKSKKTDTIEISEDLDGKTITRENFNIQIKEK